MTIYLYKLDRYLQTLADKDVNYLVDNNVYIPSLGTNYNANQLQNWLDKRINLLNDVKLNNYSDVQINNFISNLRDSLTGNDQAIADQILAGNLNAVDFVPTDDNAFETLALITLYKFVTTP